MPRFKLTLEYTGTRYSGWQKQANARTVQGELERAIAEALSSDDFDCQGAGRTDAGVHALAQVAHLDARPREAPDTLRRRINDQLPSDIHVRSLWPADARFHARHSAVTRVYLYQLARRRTALAKPYVWWVKDTLALAEMQRAAGDFVGMHDFRSFADDDPDEKSTRVLMAAVQVGSEGELLLIRVVGSHFLRKMVRRMVGVLVEVGRGTLPAAAVRRYLEESSAVPAQLTAPPSGLFLERVCYPGETQDWPLQSAVAVR